MPVVNVRVAHIRPEYQNLKEWMADENNVYIGRGGVLILDGKRFPYKDSVWANPFKISKDSTRKHVVSLYETMIREKLKNNRELQQELLKLEGKNLGCWCHPESCHGDVLLKLIEEYK